MVGERSAESVPIPLTFDLHSLVDCFRRACTRHTSCACEPCKDVAFGRSLEADV